jgi:hypothetical protein
MVHRSSILGNINDAFKMILWTPVYCITWAMASPLFIAFPRETGNGQKYVSGASPVHSNREFCLIRTGEFCLNFNYYIFISIQSLVSFLDCVNFNKIISILCFKVHINFHNFSLSLV